MPLEPLAKKVAELEGKTESEIEAAGQEAKEEIESSIRFAKNLKKIVWISLLVGALIFIAWMVF